MSSLRIVPSVSCPVRDLTTTSWFVNELSSNYMI